MNGNGYRVKNPKRNKMWKKFHTYFATVGRVQEEMKKFGCFNSQTRSNAGTTAANDVGDERSPKRVSM